MDSKDEILSTVPEGLLEQLPLKKLPAKERAQVLTIISEFFSSPIPPPHILQGYDKVLPGAADRILSMAERQEKHRQELEKQRLQGDLTNEKHDMLFSFGLLLAVLIVGALLIASNKPVEGLATLLGGAGILLAIHVWNRVQGSKSLTPEQNK